jgi:phosphoribosylamine--glycine ligase
VKILVVGSGAREHAIILSLLDEDTDHDITCTPGNAGIAHDVPCVMADANDPEAMAAMASQLEVDLVVIGPEAPLVAGVADTVREAGIPVFGPNQAAAALEGSKSFAKRIMDVAGVPTGRAHRASTLLEGASTRGSGLPADILRRGRSAGRMGLRSSCSARPTDPRTSHTKNR